MSDLTHRLTFSGHQTFPFRYSWLPKGVRGLAADPVLFRREDALVRLGVGKNMVSSIQHWCDTLKLTVSNPRRGVSSATPFGQAIFADGAWDPFLEDRGTLWLLH